MSQNRSIFNDGQGATTVDMQRLGDGLSTADDRALELIYTPGTLQKRVLPLQSETATSSPNQLLIPSPTGGAVRLPPCWIGIGSATNAQTLQLSATVYNPLDSVALAANSSGANRYDLLYAQVTRTVTVNTTRKIKSASDGTIANQSVNLVDSPVVTLGIVQGFATGATAPSSTLVSTATPVDTATVFSLPLCYVTVPTGYLAGTALTQSQITQAWQRAWVSRQQAAPMQTMSIFASSDAHKPTTPLANNSRWGAISTFYGGWKHTAPSQAAITLDSSIDWRNRMVWGSAVSYLSGVPENGGGAFSTTTLDGTSFAANYIPAFMSPGVTNKQVFKTYASVATWYLQVSASDGSLLVGQNDALNPDFGTVNYGIILFCTERFVF